MEIFKTDTPDTGKLALQDRLISELSNSKRVLWILSGSSNIVLSVQIMKSISDELSKGLTITLTDERFGPEGHKDSNWQQLIEAGFDFKSAKRAAVLQGNLKDMEYTAEQYGIILTELYAQNDVVIGQYGMGPDGHISGILPDSPAVSASGLICAYHTEQYDRITSTFEAIKKCDVAYLLAFGDNKLEALQNLLHVLPLSQQPAQILKQLPEAYVYNDQIGGTS